MATKQHFYEAQRLMPSGTARIESQAIGRRRIVLRSMAVWLAMIAAEVVHGILRAMLLVPAVGEFRSNQIGVFTGSVIIVVIACLTIRWIDAARRTDLLLVGLTWLLLTVAFEVLFGRWVRGLSWDRITADYNMLHGGLMPVGLLVLFLSPWLAFKLRDKN